MQAKLTKLEKKMTNMVSMSKKRSSSCNVIFQPLDPLGRTDWNDRFWVALSKDNDFLATAQRQFFSSTAKDMAWANRQSWRGFMDGSTESTYASVKRNSDLLSKTINLSHYQKPSLKNNAIAKKGYS